jgi:hypothetical protein
MATVLHSERMSWLAVAGRYVRMRFRHPPVEHVMQKQIRQQWTHYAPLRRPCRARLQPSVL